MSTETIHWVLCSPNFEDIVFIWCDLNGIAVESNYKELPLQKIRNAFFKASLRSRKRKRRNKDCTCRVLTADPTTPPSAPDVTDCWGLLPLDLATACRADRSARLQYQELTVKLQDYEPKNLFTYHWMDKKNESTENTKHTFTFTATYPSLASCLWTHLVSSGVAVPSCTRLPA